MPSGFFSSLAIWPQLSAVRLRAVNYAAKQNVASLVCFGAKNCLFLQNIAKPGRGGKKLYEAAALYGTGMISRSWRRATAWMAALLLLAQAALAPGLCPLWMPAPNLAQNDAGDFTIICTPQGMARIALPGPQDPAPASPTHDGWHDCQACFASACDLSVIMSDAAAIAFPAIEFVLPQSRQDASIFSASCAPLSIRGPPFVLFV